MFLQNQNQAPSKIGFLLLPRFSLMALSSAVEPLRLANTISERQLYDWTLISHEGEHVTASNNMALAVDCNIENASDLPAIMVVSSYEPDRVSDGKTLNWLRRQAKFGATLGSLDTGSYALAKAGLLDGYRATVHWEMLDSFTEEFPEIEFTQDIFVIDRDRFTCAGATAAIDMMLTLIRQQHGHDLATKIADSFIYARIRKSGDAQRMPLRQRLSISNPRTIQAIQIMENTLDDPLPTNEIAKQVGLSLKALERLFQRWLQTTPGAYYRRLRLDRARIMLQQTNKPIIEIAIENGFSSASYFSVAYKARFSRTPSEDRVTLSPL